MGIPALTRGLIIIDGFIKSDRPQRYNQIKAMISGITDASLNRLIQSLLKDQYLKKNIDGSYQRSNKVNLWGNHLNNQKNWTIIVEDIIENITRELGESAAIGILKKDRIEIKRSKSIADSISIMQDNSILHFEIDHAGSLALLDSLSVTLRKKLIKNEFSKIKSYGELEKAIKQSKKKSVFSDTSKTRKGISRVSIPLKIDGENAVLFIATTTSNLKDNLPLYRETLVKYAQI